VFCSSHANTAQNRRDESLSYGLTSGFPEPKTTIALGRSQAHLIWFLPYVIVRVAFSASRYDVIHLGDAMLSVAGLVPRAFLKRKVAVSVHGLDLTFGPGSIKPT